MSDIEKKIAIMEVQAKAWIDKHDTLADEREKRIDENIQKRNQEVINTIQKSMPCRSNTNLIGNLGTQVKIQWWFIALIIVAVIRSLII